MNTESLGGLFGAVSNFSATAAPIGKLFALYGAGFSIGKNIVKVMRGRTHAGVAVADVIRDTIIAFIIGCMIGGAGVGDTIDKSFDTLTATFLNAFGTTADPTSIISGLLYSMGAGYGPAEIFAATFPAMVIGVLAGMIFGFFFN